MADEYYRFIAVGVAKANPFLCPRMDPYAISKRVIDLLSVELNRELSPKVRQEEV